MNEKNMQYLGSVRFMKNNFQKNILWIFGIRFTENELIGENICHQRKKSILK